MLVYQAGYLGVNLQTVVEKTYDFISFAIDDLHMVNGQLPSFRGKPTGLVNQNGGVLPTNSMAIKCGFDIINDPDGMYSTKDFFDVALILVYSATDGAVCSPAQT